MNVLVPVQYPLTDANERAIRRGIELVEGHENPELLVFHMDDVQKEGRVTRRDLREAVEALFGNLPASYSVRAGFFAEEAIVEEAIRLEMDYIVLSPSRRDRWKRLLEVVLGIDQSPEQFIRDNTGIHVEVVPDPGGDPTNT